MKAAAMATARERELENALRKLINALWEWEMPVDPPRRVNTAYIVAQNLLAKITTERIKAKT